MSATTGELRATALIDRHKALGARIVPFAGWSMPVQYEGIIAEHRRVRTNAGLFDLGHMGQVEFTGPDALAFLQYTTTSDLSTLEPGQAKYGMIPNETGGVVDDIFVYRYPEGHGDGYFVVVNAANRDKDVAWWQRQIDARSDLDVTMRDLSDEFGMVAIQGPKAAGIVAGLTDLPIAEIPYFTLNRGNVAGVETWVARTGYTGEDGFELMASNDDIGTIWDALLEAGEDHGLAPIGLGARDSLRLEARMPLYGQELGDDVSPYEAGLGWAVSLKKGDFVGREHMAAVKEAGPSRKTVGFVTVTRGAAPRTHCEVQVDGRTVGEVTSGMYSPSLDQNIGLARVSADIVGVGNPIQIIVRGKPVEAVQVKTPFYKREK